MEFTNESDLTRALTNGPLKSGIKNFIEDISEDILNNVNEGIYARGGSDNYERTGDMASAVIDKGDIDITSTNYSVYAETGMDPSKISENEVVGSKFNQHMSFNGEGVADMMISWYDGQIGNSSPYFNGAIYMLKDAYVAGQANLKNTLGSSFASAGFRLTGR